EGRDHDHCHRQHDTHEPWHDVVGCNCLRIIEGVNPYIDRARGRGKKLQRSHKVGLKGSVDNVTQSSYAPGSRNRVGGICFEQDGRLAPPQKIMAEILRDIEDELYLAAHKQLSAFLLVAHPSDEVKISTVLQTLHQ